MPFKVEEEFEVQAPVQRVWEYLITPSRVVVCLPGAELLESPDDQTYLGAVKVKVGPVAMSYKGVVKFTEMDEQIHQVCMTGEGRETGGAGSAKVTMLSKVTPLPSGGSLISVKAEVDLVGKVVQFGRGMIEEVFRQLFRQFSNCVKKQLEAEASAAAEPQAGGVESYETAPLADSPIAAPVEARAVSPVPLVLNALWAIVMRFLGRLFGKQPG
ncbi:MAG TPA: SRPBCC family protein [Blastocatellia bacterium]|nr:SRPBCC family protein [Blastocatellia bacterium]